MNLQSIKRIFKKKQIAELNNSQRRHILGHYGMRPEKIQVIQQKQRWVVYEVDDKAILKITHSSDKSYETLNAISLWQEAMHNQMKEVISIIPSRDGQLSLKVPHHEGYFTSVMYHRASGEMFNKRNWNPDVVFKVGALTGKLHKTSTNIPVNKHAHHIPVWHESVVQDILKYIPDSENYLKDRFMLLLNEIKKAPVTIKNYGIIHGDIFLGNLIINDNELNIYDFDDTCISWFAEDVANVIHFSLLDDRKKIINNRDFIPHFMNCFWKGYNLHYSMEKEMMRLLPSFLSTRAIYLYAYYCKMGYEKATFPATVDFFKCIRELAMNRWEDLDYKMFE